MTVRLARTSGGERAALEILGNSMDLTYAYDQMGNPTSVVDRPTGRPVDAQCFAYDGLRQLTSAWTPADANCGAARSATSLGGPAPYWIDYTLDAAGNRKSEVVHTSIGDTTRTYASLRAARRVLTPSRPSRRPAWRKPPPAPSRTTRRATPRPATSPGQQGRP
ncbi:hypothetical protein [Cellulomonas sp. Y8]|uniref:hypothetical protein n=1 Tax=Cellulomonas sp. Y8 TaxID=2591145 RepID=UPI003D754ED2